MISLSRSRPVVCIRTPLLDAFALARVHRWSDGFGLYNWTCQAHPTYNVRHSHCVASHARASSGNLSHETAATSQVPPALSPTTVAQNLQCGQCFTGFCFADDCNHMSPSHPAACGHEFCNYYSARWTRRCLAYTNLPDDAVDAICLEAYGDLSVTDEFIRGWPDEHAA